MLALIADVAEELDDPICFGSADTQPITLVSPGEVIGGQFEILDLIGAGSMGYVYRATDLRLQREVALKVSTAPANAQWLCAEGRALARLRHPCIVGIHALGIDRDLLYLVMDIVSGEPLRASLLRGQVSIDDAVSVLIDVADALAAMHAAGLVHRDVKPDNIMRTPGGTAVLLDLGVCATPERMTDRHYVIGSPTYLAPEVILGKVSETSAPLSDIYALGVTAFELVAGRPPLCHRDTMRLLALHVAKASPPLRAHAPHAPPELERLVTEMLRKDPQQRPSAALVATWLRRLQRSRIADSPFAGPRTLRVLVAAAPADVRHMLACAVDAAGPRAVVQPAADGEAALARLRRGDIDVAVLDLGLPGISGLELCMYARGMGWHDRTTFVAAAPSPSRGDREALGRLSVPLLLDTNSSAAEIAVRLSSVLERFE